MVIMVPFESASLEIPTGRCGHVVFSSNLDLCCENPTVSPNLNLQMSFQPRSIEQKLSNGADHNTPSR